MTKPKNTPAAPKAEAPTEPTVDTPAADQPPAEAPVDAPVDQAPPTQAEPPASEAPGDAAAADEKAAQGASDAPPVPTPEPEKETDPNAPRDFEVYGIRSEFLGGVWIQPGVIQTVHTTPAQIEYMRAAGVIS